MPVLCKDYWTVTSNKVLSVKQADACLLVLFLLIGYNESWWINLVTNSNEVF